MSNILRKLEAAIKGQQHPQLTRREAMHLRALYMREDPDVQQVKEALDKAEDIQESYRIALQHIANGHPNPSGFAGALLAIGKE